MRNGSHVRLLYFQIRYYVTITFFSEHLCNHFLPTLCPFLPHILPKISLVLSTFSMSVSAGLTEYFFLNSYVAMDHKAGTLLPFIDDFINVIFSHFLDDLFNVFFSICLFTGAASLVRFILCRLIYLGNVEFTWILQKSAINYL